MSADNPKIPPSPAPVPLTGYAPVYQIVSDFAFQELISFPQPQGEDICRINVPAGNLSRKLYCWVYANNSGANWLMQGELSFWKSESSLGKLPMAAGAGTGLSQSLVSVCTANGSNVQDCIGVFLTKPVDLQPTSGLVLQPFYIKGDFDRISFSLKTSIGLTYIRVILACVSGN